MKTFKEFKLIKGGRHLLSQIDFYEMMGFKVEPLKSKVDLDEIRWNLLKRRFKKLWS